MSIVFKRKRLGKTDYRKRLKLLISSKPRLVVRKSLKHITAQVVEYSSSGDKIITSASSFELKKYGYNGSKGNLPAAYLVGYLAGKKSKEKKVTEIILDSGLYKSVKGSRIYSLLKGCIDAGLSIPCSEEILPSEDRINGKHIKNFDQKNFAESKKKVTEE
ncbi:MAG TPA: 50S ribosomal protein L18 [Candidatus Nanoarchaeia archaeon]|nr:50S ribosomal protein L18 [Candidatus Nanoarchaeia archaeon]